MPPRLDLACELMEGFAARTGLTSSAPQRRYLWTDAFAVCNFLGLAHATGDERWRDLAQRLVHDVHHVLGRHRPDDTRRGWISGLSDAQGELRPTAGGLRIGKPLPERRAGEPPDEALEWQRDGQYFHYLTKWVHALDQMARATGDPAYERQARELLQRAHQAFTWLPRPGGRKRLYWKCSIDLSRPQVETMGQHDALDGLVTCLQLDAGERDQALGLRDMARDFAAMLPGASLATTDPLGMGGLLVDAYRLHQLRHEGGAPADTGSLVALLLVSATVGLEAYAATRELGAPAERRLAFRELGLAIGLEAVLRLRRHLTELDPSLGPGVARLEAFLPLRERIESSWCDPRARANATWREHEDIDAVMLATSLAPEGFLELLPRHVTSS